MMSTLTKGFYYCLECGALFESDVKEPVDQRCTVCGNPPTGKILAGTEQDRYATEDHVDSKPEAKSIGKLKGVSQDTHDIYEATMATMEAQKESRKGRVKRTKRKGQKVRGPWIAVVVWFVLMAVTVGLIKYFVPGDEAESAGNVNAVEDLRKKIEAEEKEKALIIQSAGHQCEQAMTQFLAAQSAAAKAQFVYQGVKLSGVMSRFYRDDLTFSASEQKVKITGAELLEGFPMKVIGTVCENKRGQKWEVIFVNDGNEWKIDWPSLVRYDDRSWSLFPAGAQGEEGEFRLYMRVRDSNEDLEQKEMSLVFYKPTVFFKDEFRGVASIPVSVDIDSELGRKIQLLEKQVDELAENELRKDAYGYTVGHCDPSGYHRVRVKLRVHREGKGGKNARFELLDIIADDWYGVQPQPSAPAESAATSG